MKRRICNAIVVFVMGLASIALVSNARGENELSADAKAEIVVVIGAAGTDEYGEMFASWRSDWERLAKSSGTRFATIGDGQDDRSATDRDRLERLLAERVGQSSDSLWIVLIGHGTFAQDVANFNLRGPDVSAEQFSRWLEPIERPVVIVNCASASGPWVNRLSTPKRVIVTSTKSGNEQNFSRFGKYFAEAIASADTDLDHDDEVSVLEAFLKANSEVRRFYESEARIATEHALIDDNGDAKGTPANMYLGVRPIAVAKDGSDLDGTLASRMTLSPNRTQLKLTANESARRAAIESELDRLRKRKPELTESGYFDSIEPLMIELSRLYRDAESRSD